MLCSRFSALQTARPSFAGRLPLGLANGVLSFANGNVKYLFGELDRIAGTFGHIHILPYPATVRQCPRFQTETLPQLPLVPVIRQL